MTWRLLWINQQEFYIGRPGGQADMQKMEAKQPDVIAFNGYAEQYENDPIAVAKGETTEHAPHAGMKH
jgi:hypothetical protein